MSKTIILVFQPQITVLFRFIIIQGFKYLSGLLVKYITDPFLHLIWISKSTYVDKSPKLKFIRRSGNRFFLRTSWWLSHFRWSSVCWQPCTCRRWSGPPPMPPSRLPSLRRSEKRTLKRNVLELIWKKIISKWWRIDFTTSLNQNVNDEELIWQHLCKEMFGKLFDKIL